MVGIVLASHGEFCNGLRDSVEMLAGEIKQCATCPLKPGVDPDEYSTQLSEAIDSVETGDGVLVFVDLKGGTPFNRALMTIREKDIIIVYGANVPAVLTTVLSRFDDTALPEIADIAASEGKSDDAIGKLDFRQR